MPAAIDGATRSDIVYYAAIGYSNRDVADEVGVSRNTVRKYLELTRTAVEESADPRETLCAILEDDYDWEEGSTSGEVRLEFMSM